MTDLAKIQVPPYYPDTLAWCAKSWRGCTTTSPTWTVRLARSSQQLEDDGLAENTIVFYWSDHGDGVPRAKRSLYDSGLRVPLMIRWPKALGSTFTPGSVSDDLVSFIDLAPTVLALAGVEMPAHLQGRVLLVRKVGAGAGVRVCGARSHGHRVRHDAIGARRAVSVHPQLRARAALRWLHHLSQPERHHEAVAQAAGGAEAERAGGAVDADRAGRQRSCTTRRPIRIRFAIWPAVYTLVAVNYLLHKEIRESARRRCAR